MSTALASTTTRAVRVDVPADEPLVGPEPFDYADAFEIEVRTDDERSPEQLVRIALEECAAPVRETIWNVHRLVLHLRLGPRSSPDHVLGWTIGTSEPDAIRLEATSPLLGRAFIVARRVNPTRARITTYLSFTRPRIARAIWTLVGPLHRAIAPYLLERSIATQRSALANCE